MYSIIYSYNYNSYCVIKLLRHISLVVGGTTSSLDKYKSNPKCDHNHKPFFFCKPSFKSSSTDVERKDHYVFMIIIVNLPHFGTDRLTSDISL